MPVQNEKERSRTQIDIVCYIPGRDPAGESLRLGTSGALDDFRQQVRRAACVLRVTDIKELVPLPDYVVDCGTQKRTGNDQTIELARTLLKRQEIPLIEASYKKSGRLNQGINKLLEKAEKTGDQNLYLVAVEDAIFEALLRDVS